MYNPTAASSWPSASAAREAPVQLLPTTSRPTRLAHGKAREGSFGVRGGPTASMGRAFEIRAPARHQRGRTLGGGAF